MKKIALILVALFLFKGSAFCFDCDMYCSSNKPQKTFSGAILSATGMNFINKNVAEFIISKELKKQTNSKFKVNIKNFFATNILSGEFRGFSAKAKKFHFEDIYASDVEVKSICDYNKISIVDNNLVFDENLILKYSAKVTQDDLNKMVEGSKYKKIIDKMNENKALNGVLKVTDLKAVIDRKELVLMYRLSFLERYAFLFDNNSFLVSMRTNLKVENNKIVLGELKFNSRKKIDYEKFISNLNMFNPLQYKISLDKNSKGELKIETVDIKNNEILIDGYVLINKNKL